VTLGAVGYVDRQGHANPSQVTGVTSGATSSIAFDYDQASTLSLTISSSGGGSFPSSVPVAVGNTAFLPTGSKLFAGVGAVRTIGNLFPYADGYSAWVGGCADADPEGKDGNGLAYWPGASRATELSSSPGDTAVGTVDLPSFELRYGDFSTASGTHNIIAVHDADNGCAAGVTVTIGTFNGPGSALMALPYGTWTFKVSGASPYGGSWPEFTLDPRFSGVIVANVDAT
jgi:hypothetical protein